MKSLVYLGWILGALAAWPSGAAPAVHPFALAAAARVAAAAAAPAPAAPTPLDTDTVPSPVDTTKFIPVERVAEFEGGDAAWNDWIRKQITKRLDYLQKRNAYGKVQVGFLIEKNGTVSHVEILASSGTQLDNVVLEIMRKCPRWVPALKQDHTPVMAYRRQWFTLQAPD